MTKEELIFALDHECVGGNNYHNVGLKQKLDWSLRNLRIPGDADTTRGQLFGLIEELKSYIQNPEGGDRK